MNHGLFFVIWIFKSQVKKTNKKVLKIECFPKTDKKNCVNYRRVYKMHLKCLQAEWWVDLISALNS